MRVARKGRSCSNSLELAKFIDLARSLTSAVVGRLGGAVSPATTTSDAAMTPRRPRGRLPLAMDHEPGESNQFELRNNADDGPRPLAERSSLGTRGAAATNTVRAYEAAVRRRQKRAALGEQTERRPFGGSSSASVATAGSRLRAGSSGSCARQLLAQWPPAGRGDENE